MSLVERAATVFLVGTTGSGKSTLGNFLLRHQGRFRTAKDNLPTTNATESASATLTNITGYSRISLTVVDTPGINESNDADLVHTTGITDALKKVKNSLSCAFVVKFDSHIDVQYKKTIEFFVRVFPSIFANSAFIIMTDFATDNRSIMLRKQRGVDVAQCRKNIVKEIIDIAHLNHSPEIFMLDCLPMDKEEEMVSMNIHREIISHIIKISAPYSIRSVMQHGPSARFVCNRLYTKGPVMTAPNAKSEEGCISYSGSGKPGSVAVVKIGDSISLIHNYYEVEIVNKGIKCAIGIGVAPLSYPQECMPGWNKDSIGYHADDGNLYHENGEGEVFGPRCTQGDIMGCGVDFGLLGDDSDYVNIFFTKNGKQIGKSTRRMRRTLYGLYPTIGLHCQGEKIKYLGHTHRNFMTIANHQTDENSCKYWLRSNNIRFMDDGLTLEYAGDESVVQDVAIAQVNTPVTPTNHYFELEIIDTGTNGSIAIGLAMMSYPLQKHPGWKPGAVGYHADDGKLYKEQGYGDKFGPTCNSGDKMGCGVIFNDYNRDPSKVTVYFTKNGMVVGDTLCNVPLGGFYPIVGMLSRKEKISVNLA